MQWLTYRGPTKELLVGEYNVFIMSSTVFKNRTASDNAYFRLLEISVLIADSSMMYQCVKCMRNRNKGKKLSTTLPGGKEFREGIGKLMEVE